MAKTEADGEAIHPVAEGFLQIFQPPRAIEVPIFNRERGVRGLRLANFGQQGVLSQYLNKNALHGPQTDGRGTNMKTRVLFVEDEPDFVQLAQYALTGQGFDVVCAKDAGEAIREARRAAPDLVLLDLMLPDLDGFSVCERLRELPGTAEVPVFIISALDGMAARARGVEAGATCFFRKPVDLKALGECIRDTVQSHRTLVELRRQAESIEGDF